MSDSFDTWSDKVVEYDVLQKELAGYAQEMVRLLIQHGESHWARVF